MRIVPGELVSLFPNNQFKIIKRHLWASEAGYSFTLGFMSPVCYLLAISHYDAKLSKANKVLSGQVEGIHIPIVSEFTVTCLRQV